MKSVHLDRKLSATARLPKRSTIVESPTGKVAQRTDVAQKGGALVMGQSAPPSQAGSMHHVPLATPRPNDVPGPRPADAGPRSNDAPGPRPNDAPGPRPIQSNDAPITLRQPQPRAPGSQNAGPVPSSDSPTGSGVLRPSFARNNTQVRIVDDTLASPVGEDQYNGDSSTEGLTLGDIPQLVEAEQRRSLPRQGGRRLIAELGPLEQLIVKHVAVLYLMRSPIRDAIDMDELGELLEGKKNTFWGKLFKGGKDKGAIKKKGVFGVPLELLVEREGVDSTLGASRSTVRVPTFIEDIVMAMKQMGESPSTRLCVCVLIGGQTCRSRVYSARMETFAGSMR